MKPSLDEVAVLVNEMAQKMRIISESKRRRLDDMNTLREENTRLKNRISQNEATSSLLTEQKLIQAQRELAMLRADTIAHVPRKQIPVIPVNTQGKDSVYWHQTCRTLQMQNAELSNEIERKTDQIVLLVEKLRG